MSNGGPSVGAQEELAPKVNEGRWEGPGRFRGYHSVGQLGKAGPGGWGEHTHYPPTP